MSEQIDIKEIERKTYTTISQDGFNQILLGVVLIGFTIIMLIPNDSFLAGVFFSIIYGAYCLIVSIIVKYLRKRVSFSRIGYAKAKQRKQDLMLIFVLVAVLFFTVFSIVCIEMNLRNHPVRLLGFIIPLSAGALAYGHIYHDRLWFRLGVLYIVSGIILFMIPGLDFNSKMLLMYIGLGIVTSVSGIVRLYRFLAMHPRIVKETGHVP